MSFLTSTRSVVTRTTLPPSADRQTALTLLQDFNTFPALQPLVIENTLIAAPPAKSWLVTATETAAVAAAATAAPEYRAVTAAVPFGPFGKTAVTTHSSYVHTADGILTVFQAPLGLHGQNRWRVIAAGQDGHGGGEGEDGGGGEEGLVLLEEATLTGPWMLMPFIMMTEKKSHAELGVRFAKELEGGVEGGR